ncbi:sensor histidine kinase [Alkalicoccobacillus porphyridii]|uniref:histidine kinase n=1 Tax=Alkalicoccobacillus porphyridii TaxID=2597270 RepID=A0A553ZV10_9BACI|nr:histidine kinase [Alkalicoccobacillus porphyridii]TSB45330.1 sensor histidine kinase [Alkalicoccobacillus porphyridii]
MGNLTYLGAEWIGRMSCLCIIVGYWYGVRSDLAGFFFLMLLVILLGLRWRFKLPTWTLLFDGLICFLFIPHWEWASIGLILIVFELIIRGKPLYLLAAVFVLAYYPIHVQTIILVGFSAFAGWCVYAWKSQSHTAQRKMDLERQEKYELEAFNQTLLEATKRSVQFAELQERNRIAQELHDHVGHEVTGARLAFQAYEQLNKENSPSAEQMFDKAQERLAEAARQLRDTSHNLKPVITDAKERLKTICRQFDGAPVHIHISGQPETIPAYQLVFLESCLKESLTNISRHGSNVTAIAVELDITDQITRLRIHNDGLFNEQHSSGTGIRNLRQRARAFGGSISTDKREGFLLVCVLPISQKEQLQ